MKYLRVTNVFLIIKIEKIKNVDIIYSMDNNKKLKNKSIKRNRPFNNSTRKIYQYKKYGGEIVTIAIGALHYVIGHVVIFFQHARIFHLLQSTLVTKLNIATDDIDDVLSVIQDITGIVDMYISSCREESVLFNFETFKKNVKEQIENELKVLMQKTVSKAGEIITGIDINDIWNMVQYIESLYEFTKHDDDERLTKFIRSVKMPWFERVSVYYGGDLMEHYFDIIKQGLIVIKEDMEPYQGGVHGKEKLEVKIKVMASVIKQQMEKFDKLDVLKDWVQRKKDKKIVEKRVEEYALTLVKAVLSKIEVHGQLLRKFSEKNRENLNAELLSKISRLNGGRKRYTPFKKRNK
jgi:hypothetical protein